MLTVIKKIYRFFVSDQNEGQWAGEYQMETPGTKCTGQLNPDDPIDLSKEHQLEHRALIYLMTQKTDSVLAALTRTIEQERKKLGVVDFNSSSTKSFDLTNPRLDNDVGKRSSVYDQIMPLVRQGFDSSKISHQLALPENEISMVMRLHTM